MQKKKKKAKGKKNVCFFFFFFASIHPIMKLVFMSFNCKFMRKVMMTSHC